MDTPTVKPKFSPFPYLLPGPIVLSFIVTLRLKTPWRLVALAAYSLFCLSGLNKTTGDLFQDYVMGCTLGCNVLTAFLMLMQTDPPTEWRHKADPRPLKDMSFVKGWYYATCTLQSVRGIDWTYQVPFLPSIPSTSRLQFILRRVRQLVWKYILLDIAQTYRQLSPFYALPPERGQSMWSQGLVQGVLIILANMTTTYATLDMSYNAVSLVCVASGIHEPRLWPDVFGAWSDAYTVRRFWARVWHQNLRRITSTAGKQAARMLGCKPGTWLSARVQLVFGFIASGLGHITGDYMVAPYLTGSSMPFFLWQTVAITFEDFVVSTGSSLGIQESLWTHVVGWTWTFAWFCFSCGSFIDWSFAAGVAQQSTKTVSVVQPVLEYVGAVAGVDLLLLVTPVLRV